MRTTRDHTHDLEALLGRARALLRRNRRTAAVVGVAFMLGPLAACGGDAVATETTSDAQAQQGDAGTSEGEIDATAAFRECLAENGIELGGPPAAPAEGEEAPEPGAAPEQGAAPHDDAMAQAQEACGDLMPEGAMGGGPGGAQGGPGGAAGVPDSEAMAEWSACLAENGVEVSVPGAAGGEPPAAGEAPAERPEPGEGGNPFGLDTSDPEVAAAVEACSDLQPGFGGPPTGAEESVPDGAAAEES